MVISVKYAALMVVIGLIMSIMPVVAETPPPKPEPVVEEDLEVELSGLGYLKTRMLLNISLPVMIDLAYTVRNLTYPLFNWEIEKYNITPAKRQLELGDRFLELALNTSEIAPRRALVFAFVAIIHYSHAPPLANAVLGKVVYPTLGENGTVTEQTVIVVVNTSSELREILVNAIEYAKNNEYNTTLIEEILVKGDERIEKATILLSEGNITEAFKYAVSGYRICTRAYHLLVKTVITQKLRQVITTTDMIEPRQQAFTKVVNTLPLFVKARVEEKIKRGEIRNFNETIRELVGIAQRERYATQLRERENLEQIVDKIMNEVKEKHPHIRELVEQVRLLVRSRIRELFEYRGIRGTQLAEEIMKELQLKLEERNIRDIKIPLPKPRGRNS